MKKSLMVLFLCGAFSTVCYTQSSMSGGGGITGGSSTGTGSTGSSSTGGASPALAGHSVTVTWTASTSTGVTGYNVFRSQTTGGPYTQVNTNLIGGTSFVDSSVTAGQTYYWRMVATNSGGTTTTPVLDFMTTSDPPILTISAYGPAAGPPGRLGDHS